jgi:hypothetical protein
MERGRYPTFCKEHIANLEQTVYSARHRNHRKQAGRVVGPPNPGHKEHDYERSASSRRRIVHGQIESP